MIEEAYNTTRKNSGVSNMYTFLHAYLNCNNFHITQKYVHLTKEVREGKFSIEK